MIPSTAQFECSRARSKPRTVYRPLRIADESFQRSARRRSERVVHLRLPIAVPSSRGSRHYSSVPSWSTRLLQVASRAGAGPLSDAGPAGRQHALGERSASGVPPGAVVAVARLSPGADGGARPRAAGGHSGGGTFVRDEVSCGVGDRVRAASEPRRAAIATLTLVRPAPRPALQRNSLSSGRPQSGRSGVASVSPASSVATRGNDPSGRHRARRGDRGATNCERSRPALDFSQRRSSRLKPSTLVRSGKPSATA